jgi:hypothetical protein
MNANEAPEIVVELAPAAFENSVRRENRYAHRVGTSAAVNLEISRERGVYKVRWSWNKGRGWSNARFVAGLTESAAAELADRQWAKLVAWLGKVETLSSGGASACFSAQIASMSR